MRTYPKLRIFEITKQNAVVRHSLPVLCVPDNPDLDDIRKLLLHSQLGADEKDIFFPNWTKSLHVLLLSPSKNSDTLTPEQIDSEKLNIETAEALREILAKEETAPGTVCIVLQECRSKRYSRRKDPSSTPGPHRCLTPSPLPISISPVSSPGGSPPDSPGVDAKEKAFFPPKQKNDFIRPAVASSVPGQGLHPGVADGMPHQEAYRPIHYEPIYYDPQVTVSIVTPPSLYPQCYNIPVNVTQPVLPPFGYHPSPSLVPHVVPGYYPYGTM